MDLCWPLRRPCSSDAQDRIVERNRSQLLVETVLDAVQSQLRVGGAKIEEASCLEPLRERSVCSGPDIPFPSRRAAESQEARTQQDEVVGLTVSIHRQPEWYGARPIQKTRQHKHFGSMGGASSKVSEQRQPKLTTTKKGA